MQTRGRNRLDIQLQNDQDVRQYVEQLMDERNDDRAQPYLEQLINSQNHSETQDHDDQSNELNNSVDGTGESGNSETRKVRGPTLLKDIWKLPPEKTLEVPFNSRNQSIGKEGRKLASFLGIIARTLELSPLHIDDWRNSDNEEKKKLLNFVRKKFSIPKCGEDFVVKSLGKKWKDYKCQLKADHIAKYKTKDALLKNRPSCIPRDQWSGLVSYWLSEKAKRRTQANRNNRAKQKMPHTGGSKSIATLMDEKAENGIEPTRAEIFILTHKKRVDGRSLDDDSAKAIDMINEKMSNNEGSTDQPPHQVAWKGDVYSQVLGNERSGYVRGLGLGPTPFVLWGSRSSFGNISEEDSSNEVVKRLEHEITELKAKQNEEMHLMKQNQDNMQSELLQMRQFMSKYAPNEFMHQNINGTSCEQVADADSGHGQIPQTTRITNIAENTPISHGHTV